MSTVPCRRFLAPCLSLLAIWSVSGAILEAAPRNVVFAQDVGLGGTGVLQHEPSIAFNPANPANLVITFPDVYGPGSVPGGDCRASFTTDGGNTWNPGGVVPLEQRPGATNVQCGDPSIASDPQGNFYIAYLNANSGGAFAWDVFVAKSTDGGNSFPAHSVAVPGILGVNYADKPYIGADNQPASPFLGSLYVAWTDFGNKQFIKTVFSRDGGATWSAPTAVSRAARSNNITGALPVVAPDGTVYVFWASILPAMDGLTIQFAKSSNGGSSWGPPSVVASRLPSPGFFNLKNTELGWGTGPFDGLRGSSFPAVAVAPDGTLYVAWTDFPAGTCTALDQVGDFACSNSDVRLSVSRDSGKKWTAPAKVNDDTGQSDQFYPWIAAHPDGLLSLSWLDRRLDPNNVNYNAFYTNTSDGIAFLPNVRVSSSTSIVGTTRFVGDYTGLAATSTGVFPVWGDVRFSTPTDFTAKGTLQP